ncbi:SDR family oxidoreductase [Candidatus Hodarchaeum mangrovi]
MINIITNQRVVITGAAKGGIGEAVLKKISTQNNTIIVSSKNISSNRFPGFHSLAVDCTKERNIRNLENFIKETMGGMDCLINCIGGSLRSINPLEVTEDFFQQVLSLNLTSAFLLSQMATRLMNKMGGSVVHIVSSSAFEPEIKKMPYGIAKAGLAYLIRSFAVYLAPFNIRINGVSPTYVFTSRHIEELQNTSQDSISSYDELKAKKISKQLLQKPLLPEDLLDMIEFAAVSPIMTGKILHATLGRII